ncbi:MAG: hypothetical protein JWL77_7141 [Chthonomonadaceae bacterium]|nr:hypothetical protein [Chthonomonadaceae bacterium]
MVKRPGQSVGRNGGVFQEVGPRGGVKPNFAAVADNKRLPPTQGAGGGWKPIKRTPDSRR